MKHASRNIEPSPPDAGRIAEIPKLFAGQKSRLATFGEAAQVVELIEAILRL
ncbi:hypothetical protein [Microvirga sp. KLBC 81]|uniref:hypothetical protein n=1 Tax=Microvirga sp. KLBC 81 TaxID=1862707 RepID=UPI0014037C2F|nr:hypothetical protein [Microvirga sp. KLBC 81]